MSHIVWLRCCHVTQEIILPIKNCHFSKCVFIVVLSNPAIALLLNCSFFDLVRSPLVCVYFVFIVIGNLISMFSTMSKRKGKKIKSSCSLEEFRAEFNILMSIRLRFLEENDVNLAEGNPMED